MTNFPHRDMQRSGNDDSGIPRNSPALFVGVIAAVAIVGGLIYTFSPQPTHQITEPATPTTPAPSPTMNQ